MTKICQHLPRKLGRVGCRKDFWDRYCGRAGQLLANFCLSHNSLRRLTQPRFSLSKVVNYDVKKSLISYRTKRFKTYPVAEISVSYVSLKCIYYIVGSLSGQDEVNLLF